MRKDMLKVPIGTPAFIKKFSDDEAARKHLEKVRWNGKPICGFCGNRERIQKRKRVGFYRCGSCKKDFTVRTGTIFEKSKASLGRWLHAIYLTMIGRKGISTLQLSKEIGVTQKTAWFMARRIHAANGDDGVKPSAVVRMDKAYMVGKERNKHANKKLRSGRGVVGKQPVMDPGKCGGDAKSQPVDITAKAEASNAVYTDDHKSYARPRTRNNYKHAMVEHSVVGYANCMALAISAECMWVMLGHGYHRTRNHISGKHLHRYMNEFAYHLNEDAVDIHVMNRINAVMTESRCNGSLSFAELVQ